MELPLQDGVTVTVEPGVAQPQITASQFCCSTIPSLQGCLNSSFASALAKAKHIDNDIANNLLFISVQFKRNRCSRRVWIGLHDVRMAIALDAELNFLDVLDGVIAFAG